MIGYDRIDYCHIGTGHEGDPTHINAPYRIDPTSPPYSTLIHNEVFLDLDTTSSSDGEYGQGGEAYLEVGGVGRSTEEENLDTIYPFAWALDGRRIGENGAATSGRAESPNSMTAPITVREGEGGKEGEGGGRRWEEGEEGGGREWVEGREATSKLVIFLPIVQLHPRAFCGHSQHP